MPWNQKTHSGQRGHKITQSKNTPKVTLKRTIQPRIRNLSKVSNTKEVKVLARRLKGEPCETELGTEVISDLRKPHCHWGRPWGKFLPSKCLL